MNTRSFSQFAVAQTVSLNHLAAVQLVQPAPSAQIAATVLRPNVSLADAAVIKRPAALPTFKPSVTAKLEQIRWINPALGAAIATIPTPTGGIPRSQITVPVSLTADVSDEVLFEDPADAARKFYLPRYRIAERDRQIQLALAATPQGWSLTVDLEKYPAPALEIAARDAQEIPHEVSVVLQHRLMAGDANGGQKELVLTPPVPNAGTLRTVLQLTTQAELGLLFQVLTLPEYGAIFTVRRAVNIAIPVYTPNTAGRLGRASGAPPPRAACYPNLPAPVLRVLGTEDYDAGGQRWTRYRLGVENWADFPNDLFEAAPDLPPCGLNRNSARTWVNIQSDAATLYGFCALSSAEHLKDLWFATAKDQPPPASVFVTLVDRRCNITYTSNPVDPRVTETDPSGNVAIVSAGTAVLRGTWTFNLDTGVEGGNASDIWWEQKTETVRAMVPRGQAAIAYLGMVEFEPISAQRLQQQAYGNAPINGSIDAPGNNQLLNGSVFAVRTNGGNYAKVKVLEYGYNLQIQWVTYAPPAPSEALFRTVTRVFDSSPAPQPFVFPQALYPYIYQGAIGAANQTFKPRRWSFLWQGKQHSYYQDPVNSQIIYYLPDSFKLVRRRESPRSPMVSIRFSLPENSREAVRATIEYWAFPFVDGDRLNAASQDLNQAGVTGTLLFQPLVAGKPRLFLGLPQADGSSKRQECPDVPVELRTGFSDSITLSLAQFQSVFDALFSDLTQLFQGEVQVDFPDGPPEIIPFRAQISDLIGDCFSYSKTIDATTGTVTIGLTNAIESPLRISSLVCRFQTGETQVAAALSGFNPGLPVDLKPGETLSVVATPTSPIAPADLENLLFDLSGVSVLPDKQAVWTAILRPDSPASYQRSIALKVRKAVFGDQITDISINFRQGDTISFSYEEFQATEQLTANASVFSPISDLILQKAESGFYEFRTTIILKNGNKIQDPPDQWRKDSAETLLLTNSELPPLS